MAVYSTQASFELELYRQERSGLGAVRIESETSLDRGWRFRVALAGAGEFDLALAWADAERWSGGRVAPAEVARALVEALLAHGVEAASLAGAQVDAARLRRQYAFVDDALAHALGGHSDEDEAT